MHHILNTEASPAFPMALDHVTQLYVHVVFSSLRYMHARAISFTHAPLYTYHYS